MTPNVCPLEPFRLRNCALVVQSAAQKAQTLKELRDGLLRVPAASLHYHFWGQLLRPRPDPDHYNDFAAWVARDVGDLETAERLDALNPSLFPDLEALREETLSRLSDLVDRLDRDLPPERREEGVVEDRERLRVVLARLEDLLVEADGDSGAFFSEQAPLIRAAFPDRSERIGRALENYDFEEALEQVRAAARGLDAGP